MKRIYLPAMLPLIILLTFGSCVKDKPVISAHTYRTFRFQLYTEKDFSNNNQNIVFSVVIKNHDNILFDSVLAPMKIKDIPAKANQLIIEKTIAAQNYNELAAGFRYTIENVGNSWYTDTSRAGETFKEIDFSFQ